MWMSGSRITPELSRAVGVGLNELLGGVLPKEITMKQEYEYEVWQDHAWQAGGSTETPERAIAEADHYAMMYGQDGPVEVRFYVKQEVTRAELEERQAA